MIIGQDARRNDANDVTAGSDAFRSAFKLFSRASRRRFNGPTTDDGHLSREKPSASISSAFLRNSDINLGDLLYLCCTGNYVQPRQQIVPRDFQTVATLMFTMTAQKNKSL